MDRDIAPPRVNVLGVQVSAIAMPDAIATLARWIATGERKYVCVTGVHGVVESLDDPMLRDIHNRAGLVTPDGMPLVWLGHRAGHSAMARVYGPDLLIAAITAPALQTARHYFFGSTSEVLVALMERVRKLAPDTLICGSHSPPFHDVTQVQDAALVDEINAARPDIVWVGLGTPRQERWMAAHCGRIEAGALVGIGAAFDFIAGTRRQAPRWMQRSGFEWLFRMLQEPRRLAPRYLRNNPRFLWHIALQRIGLQRRETNRTDTQR